MGKAHMVSVNGGLEGIFAAYCQYPLAVELKELDGNDSPSFTPEEMYVVDGNLIFHGEAQVNGLKFPTKLSFKTNGDTILEYG